MEKLNLVKDRKFGENISMAFEFIKANIGNTKKVIIYLLILAVVGGILAVIPIIGSFAAMIISVIASILSISFAISYMKLYVDSSDGKVGEEEAMTAAKSNAGKIFVGNIVLGIATIIGMILLVIPGVFVAISCMFVGFCIVNNNLGAVDGMKKSFELVKNNWWITLGYVMVIGLILGIISTIFTAIGGLLGLIGIVGVAIGTILIYAVSFVISIISYFALGVHYYNLVDKKEGVNVAAQIDSIGQEA